MPALNRVQLIGYLGKDPDSRFTPNGKKVVHFSLAVTQHWKSGGESKEATEWVNVEAWNAWARSASSTSRRAAWSISKGAQDGQVRGQGETKYFSKVVALTLQFSTGSQPTSLPCPWKRKFRNTKLKSGGKDAPGDYYPSGASILTGCLFHFAACHAAFISILHPFCDWPVTVVEMLPEAALFGKKTPSIPHSVIVTELLVMGAGRKDTLETPSLELPRISQETLLCLCIRSQCR